MKDIGITFGDCLVINLLVEITGAMYMGAYRSAGGAVVGVIAMAAMAGILVYNKLVNSAVERILKERFSLAIEKGDVVMAKEIHKDYVKAANNTPGDLVYLLGWCVAGVTVVADTILYYNL